jgi:aminocarboxymuconate-semialdehyde decarboxylase
MSPYWFPWLIGMPCETTIGICSLMLGGVLERYPNLRICFAHGGGSFPGTWGRIEHGYNCRPDLVAVRCKQSPFNFLNRIWCDSLVHDPDALELLVKKIGIDKIMLGSDYPFPLGEQLPGQVVRQCKFLTLEEKEKILGLNVLAFLGLNRDLKPLRKYLEN